MTVDSTTAVAYTVAVHGTLRFNPAVNTRLAVTNLMVMGDHGMPEMTQVGSLEVGTAANPIATDRTAEIVIANAAIGGGVADPEQFGTGIINFGKFTMHGAAMTPTFLRLAIEPRAGQTTFTLSAPVSGWRPGDRLVIPDTRHMKESETTGSGWINAQNQWEELTISSVSADGRIVTLTAALRFDHLGARDLNNVLDFLPHVGNLTRNAIIRSESASGTRGHVMSVHVADTDIRYTLFRDLGRTKYTPLNTTTNAIGRYPIHMHHNRGPLPSPANGYQFTLVGNAVDGGSAETQFKWGIAVHNSHYGLIQDNVVYNYNGSSIATEDGSESFNVFDHNFALRGMGEPNNAVNEARSAMGTEGVGFWFRGPNNYVRNNVAANFQNPTTEAAYGFVYQFIRLGNVAMPNFKGADPGVAGQFTTRDGNNMRILEFDNNEVYGATQGGFTYWWVSSQDPQPAANAQESLIKNLKIWHVYNKAVYHYPSQKITFDGLIIRGKFDALARCCGNGIYGADYSTKAIIVRNSDIQGMEEGIQFPEAGFGPEPNLTVENSYLRNNSNIQVPTNGSVNGCWMQNKLVVITNTRFDAPPGRSLNNIAMVRDVGYAPECLSKLDEARVYAYNGVAADNFQIYHTSTSVLPRPPSSCSPTTRTGISGLLCPIAALGPVPPTVTLSASPASVTSGQASVLSWNSSNATTVSINQGIGAVATAGTRSVNPSVTTTYTVTATNSFGAVTASATVTLVAATPLPTATLTASPTTVASGAASTLTWSTTNATSVSINQAIGAVATSGTRSVSPTATTTYTLTATNSSGSVTATATVTVNTTTTAHNKARANAYDDAWQSGATGWVANAKAILAAGAGQVPGMVMWIGDSLTRDPALGAWAQAGAGKTVEDQMITTWLHAGLSPQNIDSVDGFALATPYFCPARSFTVGDGLGAWHFMGASSMPADTNPTTARQKLQDCATYPNALNLTTMLTALQKPQFAIPEVNLDAATPGSFPDLDAMVNLMIAKGIVPIIMTYTYRTDAAFNLLVDQYNTALVQYAQTKKLPLIDFNQEMLLRLPFAQWPGRFLSDGVHYTRGTTTYPSTSDPYANGGDPATHTTGLALTYDGYGLKGWLGVQKMKEIKELVIDASASAVPTAVLSAAPLSVIQGQSSALTWTTTNATSVSIDHGIGTVSFSGTSSVSPAATATYTITATNATGTTTATATVTVTAAPQLPTATLIASPVSIAAGATATLSWSTTNATSVTINPGVGTVLPSGTTSVSPSATTTYTITAISGAGSVTAAATVTVAVGSGSEPFGTIGLTAGWATFGQAVPQGIATGAIAVGNLPTQTDVKNRWPDGSIRFAVVTVYVSNNGNYPLSATAASSGSFTPATVAAVVNLQIGSTAYTATLPASASTDVWLAGALVREDRRVVRPVSPTGATHAFLRVNFDRRVFNDGQARVDVSVENMLDRTGATTVTYDVVVLVNGQAVFTRTALQHYYLTRWRKVFGTGSAVPSEVTPDLAPFNESRALPPYLPLVTNVVSAPTGATYDILKPGALLANMPDHGGRPELAPYPDWTARYLVYKNQTQRSFVLANGDLSGSWPIHVREREGSVTSGVGSERYVSLDQRPNIWYDLRAQAAGFDFVRGTPLPMREYQSTVPGPGQSPLIPDNAHQPSLAYVPYLLTGDRYYAEEMAFWANYSMLRTYNGDGVRSSQGILQSNEVRGFGWALRNIVDAAAYYPDASPMKAYLSGKVANNLGWLDAYANSQDPITNPFTVLWLDKRPEGPEYRSLWEETYLAYAIDRAFQQGFSGGRAHRDAIAKFQVRLFNSEPAYPRLQAAPNVVGVGIPSAGGFIFHRTMTEIWNATQSQIRPFAGYYGPEARLNLMIGIDNGWTGARDAYDYLWPFLAVQPAFGSVPDLGQRAGWALDFYPGSTPPPPPPPPPAAVPAALLGPAPGAVFTSTSQTFNWSAGTGVSAYRLDVGTTVGGTNLFAGVSTSALTTGVTGLPSNGSTVWVRLSSSINAVWQSFDYAFTAATIAPPPAGITERSVVSINGSGTVTAPAFSAAAGEIVVAFAAAGGPASGSQSLTISGAGLAWTRARLANQQTGTSEVWWAKAPTSLSAALVTSTPALAGYDQTLTVIVFAGAKGVGNSVQANALGIAPRIVLTTSQAGSRVYAIGNDADRALARTLGTGQRLVYEWVDTTANDTFWIQTLSSSVPNAGTTVTLDCVAPTTDRWNLAAIEIVKLP